MRIDFSQLEQRELPQNIRHSSFKNSLSDILHGPLKRPVQEPIAEVQEEQPILTFSVSYPYEINRTLSPASLNQSLTYMQAKKELPTCYIKFIEKQLQNELQKKKVSEKQLLIEQPQTLMPQYADKLSKNKREPFNLLNKIRQCQPAFEENKPSTRKKKVNNVKAKVYEIKKKVLRQQKHRREEEELEGVTLKPILNYTMNSKVTKQVNKKRNQHFKTCNIDVFQSLYNDASFYATKRSLERTIIEEESRSIPRQSSRILVNTTFEERLQTSIQKQAERKKKAQNKLEFDASTGKKYFIPDTRLSKNTYLTLFKGRKNSILPFQTESFPARAAHYSKDSSKLNHSQQITTTINNSYEKELNKSLGSKYKIERKPLPRENKLAELYAELIWSEQYLREETLSEQERKVLNNFLYEIQRYQHSYSRNISKQVFIAFFKNIYASMNLFDRAVLENRLKKDKQMEKLKIETLRQKAKGSERTYRSRGCLTNRKTEVSSFNLNHTAKHFFI